MKTLKKLTATFVLAASVLGTGGARAGGCDVSEIGEKMPDGTVYAGSSSSMGVAMYTTPRDAPGTMPWKAAMKYCAQLDTGGHHDWRLPIAGELDRLFKNHAEIGRFDTNDSDAASWYWSSAERSDAVAWDQHFSDGNGIWLTKNNVSSVRCVRTGILSGRPPPPCCTP